jgi:hypothetical protein
LGIIVNSGLFDPKINVALDHPRDSLNHFFDGGSTGGATHSPQFKGEIIHNLFPRVTMKFLAQYAFFVILNDFLNTIRDFCKKKGEMGHQGFEP